MTDGSPFWLLLYAACLALPALGNAWLTWRRKARAAREHPATYLSPEECARGEGQRITQDARWVAVDAHPLSPEERAEIDRALAERCRKRGKR